MCVRSADRIVHACRVRCKDPSELELNHSLSIVRGIGPTDTVEALLAVQMAAVHDAAIASARRLAKAETIEQQDSASSSFNKLSRTFAAQVEALKRHRSAGEQNVIVKHVHVYPGGQAVVGNLQNGGQKQLESARYGCDALEDASAAACLRTLPSGAAKTKAR